MNAKNEPIQVKKEIKVEAIEEIFKCSHCSKSFQAKNDFMLHVKNKHEKEKEETKAKPAKGQPRNKSLEIQQNQLEDAIYAYLGQLGEKHQEFEIKQEHILQEENQKQFNQTNYSFNKVVRTPHQKQIIPIDYIPDAMIEASKYKQFLRVLVEELKLLYTKLEEEKEKWEFRDPMAPEEETEDEFSLMEIRKLILNYPRRNMDLKFPHFSIFVLWISRICKPLAWKEFFMIFGLYLAKYSEQKESDPKSMKWSVFHECFQKNSIPFEFIQIASICDSSSMKKLAEHFYNWVTVFGFVPEFC